MPTMRGAVCGAGDEQDMFRALPEHGIPSAASGVLGAQRAKGAT